jgi:small subunit ribosomal protein S8
MLTRIRNAAQAKHDTVQVPNSKLKLAVARILKEQGFIKDVAVAQTKPAPTIRIVMRYDERKHPVFHSLERVSRPGKRVYVSTEDIPRVRGGLGVAVLSTPKGVMTGQEARAAGVGGELLCTVW